VNDDLRIAGKGNYELVEISVVLNADDRFVDAGNDHVGEVRVAEGCSPPCGYDFAARVHVETGRRIEVQLKVITSKHNAAQIILHELLPDLVLGAHFCGI
jgi:hypothetical protein